MPRESLFTELEIVDAAFDVFAHEGMSAISARRIAAKLKCSTAPVYTSFSSMEELKGLLLDRALDLLLKYTERHYTPHVFLNIGLGMLEFAKDYRLIYRALFLESNAHQSILREYTRRNLQQMKKDSTLRVFDEADLQSILDKLTVYTHGLAALICANMLEQTSQEYLIAALRDVGGDVMGATALKRGKLEEFMKGDGCNEESNNN